MGHRVPRVAGIASLPHDAAIGAGASCVAAFPPLTPATRKAQAAQSGGDTESLEVVGIRNAR